MQQVNIPDIGLVEFPDEMSQEEIISAIENDILKTAPAPEPEKTAESNKPSLLSRTGKALRTIHNKGVVGLMMEPDMVPYDEATKNIKAEKPLTDEERERVNLAAEKDYGNVVTPEGKFGIPLRESLSQAEIDNINLAKKNISRDTDPDAEAKEQVLDAMLSNPSRNKKDIKLSDAEAIALAKRGGGEAVKDETVPFDAEMRAKRSYKELAERAKANIVAERLRLNAVSGLTGANVADTVSRDISESEIAAEINRLMYPEAEKARREELGLAEPSSTAGRLASDYMVGELQSAGAALSYIGRKAGIEALQSTGDDMLTFAENRTAIEPTFGNKLVMGIGSTAAFYVPGAGVQKGTQALETLSPVMARWMGAGTMAGFEAAAEADGVYKEVLARELAAGKKQAEAEALAASQADKGFLANAAVLAVTDKVSFFSDIKAFNEINGQIAKARIAGKGAAGSGAEGLQEGYQTLVSNYFTGNADLTEGLGEAMAIGAIVGGGASTVISTKEALDAKARFQADEALKNINNASTVDEVIDLANQAMAAPLEESDVGAPNVVTGVLPDLAAQGSNIGEGSPSADVSGLGRSAVPEGVGTDTGALAGGSQFDNVVGAPAGQTSTAAVVPGAVQAKVDVGSGLLVASSGLPYKTEKTAQAAVKAKGLEGQYEATPVEGGFALRPVQTVSATEARLESIQPTVEEQVGKALQKQAVPEFEDPVLPANTQPVTAPEVPTQASPEVQTLTQAVNREVFDDAKITSAKDGLTNDEIRNANDLDALNKLREARGLDPVRPYELEEVSEDDVRNVVTGPVQQAVKNILGAFGKKPVYIRDKNGQALFFNGTYLGSKYPNTIFLDVNSDVSPIRVGGHETLHGLRRQAPDVYDALNTELSKLVDSGAGAKLLVAKGYIKNEADFDPSDLTGKMREELNADVFGDVLSDQKTLNDLVAQMQPSVAKKFLTRARMLLDKMISRLKGEKTLGASTYADLEKARAHVVAAAKEYARRVDAGEVTSAPETATGAEDLQFARSSRFAAFKREKASGRYVGAPDWVGNSTAKVNQLYNKLKAMALEGEGGKLWYEKSSKAVLDLVGGDKAEAEKFVGLLAIYSQGTEVSINTGFALEAYYQWKAGLPIQTGRFPIEQTRKAEVWLKEGRDWGGVKTNNFYVDLMEEINPAKVDETHATMDMWMAIAFDYGSNKLDQGPKYTFAKDMTVMLAKELGWKPHQVQAAIWSSIKTRVEATESKRKTVERAKGIATTGKDGKGHAIVKGKEYEHFRLAHKLGLQHQITPEQISEKVFDFSTALDQRMVQMSWETTPSVTQGSLPGIHKATFDQKMEYLTAVAKAVTVKGKNLIAEAVGLHNPPTLFGVSAWEGSTGAGAQSFFPAPITGLKEQRAVLPVARELLNDYAALKGLVFAQDAVVWHTPIFAEAESRKNGVELDFGRPLTEAEVDLIYRRVYDTFGTWDIAPGYTARGVRLLNFVEGLDNKAFQKGVSAILESLPSEFDGYTHKGFRSDGEYISNNWKENPNGEGYKTRLQGRRPDILERAADIRARVEAVNKRFSEKYNWGDAGEIQFSRGLDAGRSQGTASAATGVGGRASGVNVTGRHFSTQKRQTLEGRFYGTGLRGAEQTRVLRADDNRLRSRLYFYVNEGKGVRPEAGVGGIAHDVGLSNLYDTSTRTLAWEKDPDGDSEITTNNFESAVLDAGFAGYYRPAAFGSQGVAVLLGDNAIGVEPSPTPLFSRKLGETSQLVLMNERMKAKESWGKHLENSHLRAVEGEDTAVGMKLNTLYMEAAKQKDAFDAYLKGLAEATGLKVKLAPLKGRARTVEKIMADYGGKVDMMKDVLRATIETDSMTQAIQLFNLLSETAPIANVSGALKSSLETGTGAGYRDAKVIMDINGVPAEVIIAPQALLRAKDLAHPLYVKQRSLDVKMRETSSDSMKRLYRNQIEDLDAQMAEIYLPGAQRAQSSSAVLREQGSALSRTVSMLNGLLSGSNAKNPAPISATGMPSKSQNLVPSGSAAIGDSISDTSLDTDSIPEGKSNSNDDISMSRKTDEIVEQFSAAVKGFNNQPVKMADNTPATLRLFGWRDLPIVVQPEVIDKMRYDHGMTDTEIGQLPYLLNRPAMIFADDKNKALVYVGDVKGKPTLTAMKPERVTAVPGGRLETNMMVTGYVPGLGWDEAVKRIMRGELVYRDTTATTPQSVKTAMANAQKKFAQQSRRLPTEVLAGSGASIAKRNYMVLGQSDLVKWEKENWGDEPLFSRNSLTGSKLALEEESKRDFSTRMIQNDQVRWKRQIEAIRERGGVVNDQNNVYQAMERMSARAMNRTEDFYRERVEPVLKKMRDMGVNLEQVGEYLYALHAKERNAAMKEINPRFTNAGYGDVGGSGMSDAEADQIVADTRADANFKNIEAITAEFRSWADANLDGLVDGGLITQEQAEAMRDKYPNYVPLKGFAENMDEPSLMGQGSGYSTAKDVVKRALGRGSRAGNPAVFIIHGVAESMLAREKANVGRYLERLINDNPDAALWTIGEPSKTPLMGTAPVAYEVTFNGQSVGSFPRLDLARQYIKAMNLQGATVDKTGGEEQVVLRDMGYDPEKEVRFIRDGKQVRIQINDPLLTRGYNNGGMEELGALMRFSSTINGFLREMWTQKNPVFPLVNAIRDVPSGMLYATGQHGAGMAVSLLGNIPSSWRAMWQQAGGKPVTGVMGQWMKEYRAAGGGIGFRMVSDVQSTMDKITRIEKKLGGKTIMQAIAGGDIKEAGKRLLWKTYNNAVIEFIERLNIAFENMTRLAIFKAAREKGLSTAEASRLAKNATVNFNRRGEKTQSIGALYLFFNAAVQDAAKHKDTIIGAEKAGQAKAALAGVAALGFIMGMLDDDDDDLQEENRNVNTVRFKVGDTSVNIPLSYGLIGVTHYLGRSAALALKGEDLSLQSLRLASALMHNLLPINPIPDPDRMDAQNALIGMTPTALELPVSVALNRNSFGSDMMPDYNNDPDAYKSWRGTRGTVYATLAAFMNESTGGTVRESGMIDVSPETLKNVVHFVFGGTGKFVADTGSTGSSVLAGAEVNPNAVPVLNRFVKKDDVGTYRSRFYRQAGEAKDKRELYNKYKKDRNTERMAPLRPYVVLGARGDKMWKQINMLRDKELAVSRDDTLSTKEKDLRLKELALQQIAISNKFHELYKDRAPQ